MKKDTKEFLQVGAVTTIGVFILFYFIALGMNVFIEGKDYGCAKIPKYRIDYIFPARQISCFLYKEVGE